jgi:hypothetical protein
MSMGTVPDPTVVVRPPSGAGRSAKAGDALMVPRASTVAVAVARVAAVRRVLVLFMMYPLEL